MQIAIASTDGVNVNQHFGRAEKFVFFEMIPDEQILITVKEVTPLSEGDKNHTFDPKRFAVLAASLRDCKRVYCTKIGDKPAEELKKLGIEPIIFEGPITNISV